MRKREEKVTLFIWSFLRYSINNTPPFLIPHIALLIICNLLGMLFWVASPYGEFPFTPFRLYEACLYVSVLDTVFLSTIHAWSVVSIWVIYPLLNGTTAEYFVSALSPGIPFGTCSGIFLLLLVLDKEYEVVYNPIIHNNALDVPIVTCVILMLAFFFLIPIRLYIKYLTLTVVSAKDLKEAVEKNELYEQLLRYMIGDEKKSEEHEVVLDPHKVKHSSKIIQNRSLMTTVKKKRKKFANRPVSIGYGIFSGIQVSRILRSGNVGTVFGSTEQFNIRSDPALWERKVKKLMKRLFDSLDVPMKPTSTLDINKLLDRVPESLLLEAREFMTPTFSPTERLSQEGIQECLYRLVRVKLDLRAIAYDNDSVTSTLVRIVTFLYGFIILILLLLAWGVNVSKFVLPVATFMLGLSFVFSASLRRIWDGAMLFFGERPFAIGDRIRFPDSNIKTAVFVEQLGLLSTRLRGVNGSRYTIPNDVISSGIILNETNSDDVAIDVAIRVHPLSFSKSNCLQVQEVLAEKMLASPYPFRCNGNAMLVYITEIELNTYLQMNVWVRVAGINASQGGAVLAARTEAILLLEKTLVQLGIDFETDKVLRLLPTG